MLIIVYNHVISAWIWSIWFIYLFIYSCILFLCVQTLVVLLTIICITTFSLLVPLNYIWYLVKLLWCLLSEVAAPSAHEQVMNASDLQLKRQVAKLQVGCFNFFKADRMGKWHLGQSTIVGIYWDNCSWDMLNYEYGIWGNLALKPTRLECWSIFFWEGTHFEAFNWHVMWSQDGTEIFYQSIKPKEKAWSDQENVSDPTPTD